jgi:type VI secretion system protein ImpH
MSKRSESPYARLQREPRRFGFDAAVRILGRVAERKDVAEAARFRTAPGLAFPPADVTLVQDANDGSPPRVTVTVMGLTGTSGVLPRYYTEVLSTTLRDRSRALHDFLDMLAHRLVALFAGAGTKYRLHRAAEAVSTPGTEPPAKPDPVSQALLSLTGYGTPYLTDRLSAGTDPLLHYSGFFATHPRSADRLEAMASDWLGRPVQVQQFAGAWLPLAPDQQTSLAVGKGVDAAIGTRAWDVQARIILRVGPMDRSSFEALLPDRPALRQLVSLVRAYLGFETGFAVNPVLAAPDVPPLHLTADADPPPRLGWNTWIPPIGGTPWRAPKDAADAVFEAEVVEATDPMLKPPPGRT